MQKFIAVFVYLAVLVTALPTKEASDSVTHEKRIPKYQFEYGVKDVNTGDHKVHWEKRDGNHVQGSYTVEEADGGHRIVNYQTDDKGAMQIQVTKVPGHGGHNGHAGLSKTNAQQEPVASRHYEEQEYPNLYRHFY